ncbi:MAG TPA: hypothetical protein PKH93_10025, partial [Chitinophagales bacterium]|nr:hypothetical protein [Chitinophagales bacterium]
MKQLFVFVLAILFAVSSQNILAQDGTKKSPAEVAKEKAAERQQKMEEQRKAAAEARAAAAEERKEEA